jgi:hypothetical protein
MKNLTCAALAIMVAVGMTSSEAFAGTPQCKGQKTAASNASKSFVVAQRNLTREQRKLESQLSKVAKKNAQNRSKADKNWAKVAELGVKMSGRCSGDLTTSISSLFTQISRTPSVTGVACTASNSLFGPIVNAVAQDVICDIVGGIFGGGSASEECQRQRTLSQRKRQVCAAALASNCGKAVNLGKKARSYEALIISEECTPENPAICKDATARRSAQRIGTPTTAGSLAKVKADAELKNTKAQTALVCCQEGKPVAPDGLQCVTPTPPPAP